MSQPFIHVTHEFSPEPLAMLQALYSRDPRSVLEHIKRVEEVGAEKFMASFYVGYGHKSIGDCGTTTVFIEQVSMLCAKAFQDWPLYNGQEASTRYLDMTSQEVRNPLGSVEGGEIQREWMAMYVHIKDALIPHLRTRFPRSEGESEKIYDKAILAKAFDIARGWLPAGTTTLLAWHTNLRQAFDHLQQLEHHPLAEIRQIAGQVHTQLRETYPSSFSHKRYEATENYLAHVVDQTSYFHDISIDAFSFRSRLDHQLLAQYTGILWARPAHTELPAVMRRCGDIVCSFLLDFASYRDLQRHRSGTIPMPLLSLEKGFHPWYLGALPDDLRAEIEPKMAQLHARVAALDSTPEVRQYYIPMGYQCTVEATLSLPSAVYISELRSAQTVHPTLRIVSQQMGAAIQREIPSMALHLDMNDDIWSVKRGTHDIVKK